MIEADEEAMAAVTASTVVMGVECVVGAGGRRGEV